MTRVLPVHHKDIHCPAHLLAQSQRDKSGYVWPSLLASLGSLLKLQVHCITCKTMPTQYMGTTFTCHGTIVHTLITVISFYTWTNSSTYNIYMLTPSLWAVKLTAISFPCQACRLRLTLMGFYFSHFFFFQTTQSEDWLTPQFTTASSVT